MWPFGGGRREEKRSLEEWRSITEFPWDTGGSVVGGASMNVDRALSLIPVFGAARLIADTVSSLTPVLYTTGSGGLAKKMPVPPLFRQPSIHGTLVDWLHRGTVSMCLQGDAIGIITQRDFYNFPTMIEWANPDNVQTNDGNLSGPGSYMNPIWWWNGRRINNPDYDLVHIPWFTMPWRVRGLSPIGAFRVTANVGLGAQEYASEWFNNGGVPPGTFKNAQQKVTKEEADILTARITKRLKTRQPLVYGNDWEYTPIAIKPNEAQFIETAQLTATQIATIYGLPPDKIGGTTGDSLTYATVEQNMLDYLVFSARPWLVKWEQALNKLFPRGQYVKFETSEMLRTDAKARAEIDRIALGPTQPYKTVDEVRASRDLPPMPKQEIPASAVPVPAPPGTPAPRPPAVAPGTPVKPKQAPEAKSISGQAAITYLRSRVPQSQPNPSPILKPPTAANGTKPLAVGSK